MLQLVAALDRLGTESAFEVLARADALQRQGKSIVNLGIGQPDFKTPAHIVEAAIKALRDGHHGYTPAQGILPLREAVARDLKRRHGVEVHPDTIVIWPGGKPTMFFSILIFGQPGAEILYPDPGFPIYRSMIEYCGAKPVPIVQNEANEFSFTADQVLSLITPRTSLIILNSPGNPCGGAARKEEIEKLVAGLERFPNVAVMSDEIYGQMLYGGPRAHELPALPCDQGPADHARRLVQDLRHDRLAARLLGVAEERWWRRSCGSPSTAIPASTPRRSTPASPPSTARRTRCTRWWLPSTSAAAPSCRC